MTCANPNCPKSAAELFLRKRRRIQILDQELQSTGEQPSAGTVLYHFAAVTCSAACAIAVLEPLVEREQRERQATKDIFPVGN